MLAALLAFLAGAITLLNPCVLPILPVVFASALAAGRGGLLALAAGMALSFVALGVGVAAAGPLLGLSAEAVQQAGAVLLVLFGLVMLLPAGGRMLARAMGGVSALAGRRLALVEATTPAGQFATGTLLGAVWSPCVGPTLGAALALASQGEALGQAAAIMAAYVLGLLGVLVALALGAQSLIARRRGALLAFGARARALMGGALVLVGTLMLTGLYRGIESALLDLMPAWLVDLTVAV